MSDKQNIKTKSLLPNCEEATLLISKENETALSFAEKLRMNFHLLYCRFCRLFRKESHFIDKNIQHLHDRIDQNIFFSKMDEAKKVELNSTIQNNLSSPEK